MVLSLFQMATGDISGTGGMSSGYLDVINYATTAEKAIKYCMYIQNNTNPADCAFVEFNVLINGNNFRSLEIVKTMVPSSGTLYEQSEDFGQAGLVVLLSAVGDGAQGGTEILPQCAGGSYPVLGTNLVGVALNRCIQGTYNITLYKMSIEA